MQPYLQVGPVLVQLPGLVLLAGIWLSTNLVEREAGRLRLHAPTVLNMIMYGLIAGILGARIIYALEHVNAYLAAPLSLLAISWTALDPWGGLIAGGIAAVAYGRRKALPVRPTLDALAPGVSFFMIAVGLANLLSGSGYGAPTDVPWAVRLWGEYRHPTQIYETLLAAAVLLTWRFTRTSALPGIPFLQVMGLSAAWRIFTEAFHGDSFVTLGGFRLPQVFGLAVLAGVMYVANRWSARTPTPALTEAGPVHARSRAAEKRSQPVPRTRSPRKAPKNKRRS